MFGGKLGLPELIILAIIVAGVVKAGISALHILGGRTKRQPEPPTARAKAAAVPTSSSNSRFCTKCGEKAEPAGISCAACGAPIK